MFLSSHIRRTAIRVAAVALLAAALARGFAALVEVTGDPLIAVVLLGLLAVVLLPLVLSRQTTDPPVSR